MSRRNLQTSTSLQNLLEKSRRVIERLEGGKKRPETHLTLTSVSFSSSRSSNSSVSHRNSLSSVSF